MINLIFGFLEFSKEDLKHKLKINYKELKNCIFKSTFYTTDKDSID